MAFNFGTFQFWNAKMRQRFMQSATINADTQAITPTSDPFKKVEDDLPNRLIDFLRALLI
jgi:hypothetical protein